MLIAWRIVREKHLATAFSGLGAAEFGGRWNLPGTRIVYTSQSLALAALELIVHLNPPVYPHYKAFRIQFDESLIETFPLYQLPSDWAAEPPSLTTQRLGSRWAAESRTVALAVPSAIVPAETNFLINPMHPDYARVNIGPPQDFTLDRRLI